MIYTSHHDGLQIGTSTSISLRPPNSWEFERLPLFAPTRELLTFWKASKKDQAAQDEYTKRFKAAMQAKNQTIDLWLVRVQGDITLNCYEITGFCHRHIVGEIIKAKRPELWGGEASNPIPANQNTSDKFPLFQPQISCMDWLEQEHGIKLYDVPAEDAPKPIEPWRVNVGKYVMHAGELVKVVGGGGGKWQLERSPEDSPVQTSPGEKNWVKTSSLVRPSDGHKTWSDRDFKKVKRVAEVRS